MSEWAQDMRAERREAWSDYVPETPEQNYVPEEDLYAHPVAGRFDTPDYDPWAA